MDAELAMMIENMPPLCASLPYKFTGGNSKIENIEVHCAGCSNPIKASDIKGEFTEFNHISVSLKAYGICYACQLVTPIESKFTSDGDLLCKGPSGWRKGQWGKNKRVGWGSRIIAYVLGETGELK